MTQLIPQICKVLLSARFKKIGRFQALDVNKQNQLQFVTLYTLLSAMNSARHRGSLISFIS